VDEGTADEPSVVRGRRRGVEIAVVASAVAVEALWFLAIGYAVWLLLR
jgi:hypothetical protein